jgi:hypothetical protein
MSRNNSKRKLSFIVSVVFIFVSLTTIGLTPENVYANVNPYSKVEAESFNRTDSPNITASFVTDCTALDNIKSGNSVCYDNLDFDKGATSFKARIACAEATNLRIIAGRIDGNVIGTLTIPSTGSISTFKELSCSISNLPSGTTSIFLVFGGPISIDWFMFTPSSTTTQTPGPISGSMKVELYNNNTSTSNNTISLSIRITNTGSSNLDLSYVKMRYYYTTDNTGSQSAEVNYAGVGLANVTATTASLSPAFINADHYAEIGFSSGAVYLSAGVSTLLTVVIKNLQWNNYIQTNDYSFNPNASTYTASNYVTGYINNNLVWGVAPSISNSTLAPTQTPTPAFTPASTQSFSTQTVTNTPVPTPTRTRTSTPTAAPTPTPTPTIRSAFVQIQAESYNRSSNIINTFGIADGGSAIGNIEYGYNIVFDNVNFGSGIKSVKIRAATKFATNIEVRLGNSTGFLLGTLAIASTGSFDNYQEFEASTVNYFGVNNLCLVFSGSVNVDWLMFTPTATTSSTLINAFSKIEAESYSYVSNPNIQTFGISNGGRSIGYIESGDYISFNNLNFSSGTLAFNARVANSCGSTSDIQIRLGNSTGILLGTLSVPSTDSWDSYQELNCTITNIKNIDKDKSVYDLYLVFTGPVNFDWFKFEAMGVTSTPVITPTPTPSPTSTSAPTSAPTSTPTPLPTPSPTPQIIAVVQPYLYLTRYALPKVEIGSSAIIQYGQSGYLSLNGLAAIKEDKEIVVLVDNTINTKEVVYDAVSQFDYALFANRNLRGVGRQSDVYGDVAVNNTFETYIANLNVSGTVSAGEFTIGYGAIVNGRTSTLTSPMDMPVFHNQLIDEAEEVFKPSDFVVGVDVPLTNHPGFNIRYESNNTFVITCLDNTQTFVINSSMYFQGNLKISVPYIENKNSNFLIADGSIRFEGHSLNQTDENPLNVYSIHGKITLYSENSTLSGTLFAAGVPGNPLYTEDVGVILLQGMNTDFHGPIIAGSDMKLEASSSTYYANENIASEIEKKYFKETSENSYRDAAKLIVNEFAGSDTKICALQFSDSANDNDFNLYDLSIDENVAALKNVIDNFPENTSNLSNLGDALRRAYYVLSDPSKSSPDASKYIIVLTETMPNRWTSNDALRSSMKTTDGDAEFVFEDILNDGNSVYYASTIGSKIKPSGISTIFVCSSTDDTASTINQIAIAAGAAEVSPGKHYYSMLNIAELARTIYLDPPKDAVLRDVLYEEIFPDGITVVEGPPDSTISLVNIGGTTRYKVTRTLDVKLTYEDSKYIVEPLNMTCKVKPNKLESVTFPQTDSKVSFTLECYDRYGNPFTLKFTKNYNELLLDVVISIDVN